MPKKAAQRQSAAAAAAETAKYQATRSSKRTRKTNTKQSTPTGNTSSPKGTIRGPNPRLRVYIEIPVYRHHHLHVPASSIRYLSETSSTQKSQPTSVPEATETENTTATSSVPARPRRVILRLTSPSSSSHSKNKLGGSVSPVNSASASAARYDASSSSASSSIRKLPIDPNDLAQSLDQYDEEDDPQTFDTLVIPSRSPTTEKTSYYVGDACDPRSINTLKRKRSDNSLLSSRNTTDPNSHKRNKLYIRVPGRRPERDMTVDSKDLPKANGGKVLSTVLELADASRRSPDLISHRSDTEPCVRSENTRSGSYVNDPPELCTMCASWKKALESLGSQDWLAPAGPEECDRCQAKAALTREEGLPHIENNDGTTGLALDLPPSMSRMTIETEDVASPLEGPEVIDEALLREEVRAALSPSDLSDATPSLTSSRSSISLDTIDEFDYELGYPESYNPSPLPSPGPLVLQFQANVRTYIAEKEARYKDWLSTRSQPKVDAGLGLDLEDKHVTEESSVSSNELQGFEDLYHDLQAADNDLDGDVDMSEWLSSAVISTGV